MLLVVAEDLKHDGLALDVLDEGLGHLHRNLVGEERRQEGEAMPQERGRRVAEVSARPPRRTGLETLTGPDLCPRRGDAPPWSFQPRLPSYPTAGGQTPASALSEHRTREGTKGRGHLCGLL